MRPMATPTIVPVTKAMARPSNTAPSVAPVKRQNSALVITFGNTAAMPLGRATNAGAHSRTPISHSSRMTMPGDNAQRDVAFGERSAAKIAALRLCGERGHRLSPRQAAEAIFQRAADRNQHDAENGDDQDRGVETGRIEILARAHDQRAHAARRQEQFGRDHADQSAPDRLPDAGERITAACRESAGRARLPIRWSGTNARPRSVRA